MMMNRQIHDTIDTLSLWTYVNAWPKKIVIYSSWFLDAMNLANMSSNSIEKAMEKTFSNEFIVEKNSLKNIEVVAWAIKKVLWNF